VKGLGAIYRRELAGLFLAPLAWILLFLVLGYQAYFFLLVLASKGGAVNGSLAFVLGGGTPFWLLSILLPPLLTMRMISEESRSGMLEFLLTAPVSDAAVVVGKALAATTFLALAWASVFLFALAAQLLGAPPDWGHVLALWIGASLVSALFSGLGLVASALFSTPLLAAFMAILVNIALFALPLLSRSWRGTAGELLGAALARVDVLGHFQGSFLTGALDSAHVAFFLAWTAAALFVAVRVVESRRWLG
jgi:ABC-2 type transport system permease protein